MLQYFDKIILFTYHINPTTFSLKLMGSLFDALEYYFKLYELSNNVHLVLLRGTGFSPKQNIINQLHKIIEKRYTINAEKYIQNIVVLLKTNPLVIRCNKALVLDLSTCKIIKTYGLYVHKELIIIPELTLQQYYYTTSRYKVIYYGEMPFTNNHINYRMKFYFDIYRQYKDISQNLFVNCPRDDYNHYTDYKKIIEQEYKDRRLLLKTSNISLFDLHKHFSEYIYFKSKKWFDPHPRLFHECLYYNKRIHYYNALNIKDGSYYRYQDAITNGLENRFLNENDEIIQRMLEK